MSTNTTDNSDAQRQGIKQNEKKWGKKLLDAGWSMIPNVFLERQKAFGLDAIDINILLHLVRHWWYQDNLPHPSKATIAECMGIGESTVRKRIKRMQDDGLVVRKARFDKGNGQQTNEYDLSGLIKDALPYAQEMIETKEARKREDVDRRRRKRAKVSTATS